MADLSNVYAFREGVYEAACVPVTPPHDLGTCRGWKALLLKAKGELGQAEANSTVGSMPKVERESVKAAIKALEAIK